jgi:hypothetical protein
MTANDHLPDAGEMVSALPTVDEMAFYDVGWTDGWDAHAERVQSWLGITREALRLPTRAEVAKARTCDNRPCPMRCQRCSKCFRSEAAYRNQQRYGSPDYPGVEKAAQARAQREGIMMRAARISARAS